jgi:peptidoglycan/LPS O-acetylase OafA/YrhL
MGAEGPARAGRLPGLDAVKGLSILGVVVIHAAPPGPSLYHEHVVSGLARLAVPCFLVVTGYLAGIKASSRGRMRSYLVEFLRLHLIYGAFYWAVELARRGIPEALTLKEALLHFGEASYPGQYYFVILIQVFLLAWALPERLWKAPAAPLLWAAVALLALGVLLARGPSDGARPDALAQRIALRALTTAHGAWLWFYYFALGAWLGDRARRGLRPPLAAGAACAAAGIAVATLALPDWPYSGSPPALPYARVPIYVGATLVALGLPALARLSFPRPLTAIGAESFTIFVLNPALLLVLALLFGRATTLATSWLYVALTLAMAWALARPLRRWAPFAVP